MPYTFCIYLNPIHSSSASGIAGFYNMAQNKQYELPPNSIKSNVRSVCVFPSFFLFTNPMNPISTKYEILWRPFSRYASEQQRVSFPTKDESIKYFPRWSIATCNHFVMTITADCDMSCQPSITRVTWGYNGAGEENVCRVPGKFCALTAKAPLRRAGAQFPRAKSAASVTFIRWKVRMDVLTFILYANHI